MYVCKCTGSMMRLNSAIVMYMLLINTRLTNMGFISKSSSILFRDFGENLLNLKKKNILLNYAKIIMYERS